MNPVRVLLIDDEELLIESLEIILTVKGNMQVVGLAYDGNEALEKLTHLTADIALVDLNMKGMGGTELIPILKRDYPDMKILVLTTFYDDHYISAAISNGADGYLLKDSEEENLIRAIHQILSGQSILDSKVMKILSQSIVSTKQKDNKTLTTDKTMSMNKTISMDKTIPKDLTRREMEVCVLIAEGYTNTNIAEKLYISEGTVKNYMSSIYDKFELRDRTQLAILLKNILKK